MFISLREKHLFPYLIVLFLTVTGFVIRVFLVNTHPPVDVDEYSIAYNAYTIVQTGKDEWGISFPLFFKAFGDYKLPLDIYFVALLFKLFNPNFFWLRFPAIFFGTLYIPLIYIFLKQIIKSQLLIFLGTSLMVFSPYGIFSPGQFLDQSQEVFLFFCLFYYLLFISKKTIIIFFGEVSYL